MTSLLCTGLPRCLDILAASCAEVRRRSPQARAHADEEAAPPAALRSARHPQLGGGRGGEAAPDAGQASGRPGSLLPHISSNRPGLQGQIHLPPTERQDLPGAGLRVPRTPGRLGLLRLSLQCVSTFIIKRCGLMYACMLLSYTFLL